MKAAAKTTTEVIIEAIKHGTTTFALRGCSDLWYNRLSDRARHTLLYPNTESQRGKFLKHDPDAEFRDCMHTRDGAGPTRLVFPASGFKKALMSATKDFARGSGAQVGRLVWVQGPVINIYGVPKLSCEPVVQSGMNAAPDLRTRAVLTDWAATVTINYVMPMLNETVISRLLSIAGMTIGIGDRRQELGSGCGQFELAALKDIKNIMAGGGIAQQDAAIANIGFYNQESQDLVEWFRAERIKRGQQTMTMAA